MKSEQKAANALRDAVSRIDFNPFLFAKLILQMETAIQWRILTAFVTLARQWREVSSLGLTDLADVVESNPDAVEVMDYVDEANKEDPHSV